MKIVISAEGKNNTDLLDARFGRCPYFQIYDTETKEFKCVENKGAVSSGGAGIVASEQVIDENIDVVITGNLGPNAYRLLKGSEIKMFKSNKATIKDVLKCYEKGELEEIIQSGPEHGGIRK
ncbi:dinitrogenase iron-molybdenum cofactor [Clostridium acetireducens DSM 10703]|uniref:Dinitrogenase iron-molybdenum cofactor n=1 Tax=Clostridium acetireducens DSM 10703 TaxID=1121290 RepID=A0A1E8F157_9CLOT|nr:NifB/NifX family molybdenum-iron cluster-binding protein [Clostridium acetireducens]OFI07160.1 dinitrogenase iron-molybdenum cofactor [Clostridium acetireducens DSM 10703]